MNETLPMPSPGDSIKAEHIRALSRAIKRRTPRPSPSIAVQESEGGFSLTSTQAGGGAGGTFSHNWKPRRYNEELITISPGYAAGGWPLVEGTSIAADPAPTLSVHATNLQYIYLKITLTLTTVSGYVTGRTITSRIIDAYDTPQTSIPLEQYFLLFTWRAGRVVDQYTFWSFALETRDDGTATTTPEHRTWVTA